VPEFLARFTAKLCCVLLIAVACINISWAQGAADESRYRFNGSLRTRYESKQDFNFSGGDQTYFLTQLRLDFRYRANERANVFVQLQDARVFGESRFAVPAVHDAAVPNVFADQLDFHQAYLNYDWGAVTLRAGRQKFNLADSRLVASLEWVNTARVHDGIRLTFGSMESRQIEVFASALVAVDPDHLNDQADVGNRYFDSDFHGIFVAENQLPVGELEYWYFYRGNSDFSDRVSTVGARLVGDLASWRLDLQSAYQFGDFGGLDHSAYMLHAGLEKATAHGRFGIAYNFASGDDNPNDAEHGTFDNLFPLNHPYYGLMDLFSLQNVHNFELTYSQPLTSRLRLQIGVQNFWLHREDSDAWYSAALQPLRRAHGNVGSYVGGEIDVTATMALLPERLALVAGVSRFFGGRYLRDTGSAGDANFFFVQLRYTP
jgi:hypothetical protein